MRLVIGSTLALILMNASGGRTEDAQQQYERNAAQERAWQQQHAEHLERQEQQQAEQFRRHLEERERREEAHDDAPQGETGE